MTIIDLLNKIANGETPKKIIYLPYATNNEYAGKYSYEQGDYLKDGWINMWLFKDHLKAKLNDEIEIIEEDKDIEKISWNEKESLAGTPTQKEQLEILARRSEKTKKVLNELINEVNKLKKEK